MLKKSKYLDFLVYITVLNLFDIFRNLNRHTETLKFSKDMILL